MTNEISTSMAVAAVLKWRVVLAAVAESPQNLGGMDADAARDLASVVTVVLNETEKMTPTTDELDITRSWKCEDA